MTPRRHSFSPARRRQQQQRSEQNRRGFIMIGLSAGVVLLCIVLGMTVLRPIKVDPRTGCAVDHKALKAHTVILVDETDVLGRDDLAYAKSVINNEYYWLPVGGRLTVRNIVADPEMAEDIVVCRMIEGSEVLGASKNPKKVAQEFQKIVGVRMDELFTALRTAKPQSASPIMEYAAGVLDRANFGPNIKTRRLVLISDAAQHSDLYSQYGRHARPHPSKAAQAELRRDMTGVHVRVHYIARRKLSGLQGEAHRQFWIDYFEGMGADVALGHGLLIGEKDNRETWNDGS